MNKSTVRDGRNNEKAHAALIEIDDSGQNSLMAVRLTSVCYNLRTRQL